MARENVELVRRFLDALGRDDLPAALACLDSGVDWVPQRAATEGTFHGHEGFEQFITDTRDTFEVFEPHVELRSVGEQVLAWGTVSVRGSGSGVEMDIPVGGIFDFRDGRIARWRGYGSKEQALEATGRPE